MCIRDRYYPPLGDEPVTDTTRCGEHTDYGTFTLLAQDSEGGLEVIISCIILNDQVNDLQKKYKYNF